jgi:hypothetical protein
VYFNLLWQLPFLSMLHTHLLLWQLPFLSMLHTHLLLWQLPFLSMLHTHLLLWRLPFLSMLHTHLLLGTGAMEPLQAAGAQSALCPMQRSFQFVKHEFYHPVTIWGGGYEEFYHPGYDLRRWLWRVLSSGLRSEAVAMKSSIIRDTATHFESQPTSQRNISSPFCGSVNRPNKKPAQLT